MISKIPKSVLAIGLASLLINAATIVTFSATGLYLKTVLCISATSIGLLESVVEGVAYLTRTFSGVLSDFFKKRKIFIVLGFFFLTISKPILALVNTYSGIFFARTIDRIGNGIQASPRDALVSDLAPRQIKGSCYGLRQSLALIGSSIGGILGIVVMNLTNNNFQLLFLLATIPAIFAFLISVFFIRDAKINKASQRQKITLKSLKSLGHKFWLLMLVVAFFMLGKFSEVFICLHATDKFGLNIGWTPIFPVIYSFISTLVAYPMGKISDAIDRKKVLLFGICIFVLSHLSIGLAPNLYCIFIGCVLWGIHEGITDSTFASLISDFVPKELRGTSFGVYSLISSLSMVLASTLAGIISDKYGMHNAFIYGAFVGIIAILFLTGIYKILKNCAN